MKYGDLIKIEDGFGYFIFLRPNNSLVYDKIITFEDKKLLDGFYAEYFTNAKLVLNESSKEFSQVSISDVKNYFNDKIKSIESIVVETPYKTIDDITKKFKDRISLIQNEIINIKKKLMEDRDNEGFVYEFEAKVKAIKEMEKGIRRLENKINSVKNKYTTEYQRNLDKNSKKLLYAKNERDCIIALIESKNIMH